MRPLLLLLSFFWLPHALAQNEVVTAQTTLPLLDQVGVKLLCEQTVPLLQRGQPEELQGKLSSLFDGQQLCQQLADQVAGQLSLEQASQAQTLLGSDMAQRFSLAERSVMENPDNFGEYRDRLRDQAPRAVRVDLIKRLDSAAHTTELASILRYELGKTQALLALLRQGQTIDEMELSVRTKTQADAIRQSSAEAVQAFMLYAYRKIPSHELEGYVEMYESPAVRQILVTGVQSLPQLFAQRRDSLRQDMAQISAVR